VSRHADVEPTLESVREGLRAADYVTTPRVETALLLALRLEKPLLVEGPAGAGKTELAKVLAAAQGTRLLRLQCYEGLDEARALFEWNYQKQLLRIHADRAEGRAWDSVAGEIFGRDYLLARPLLEAIWSPERVVLLVDEVDKADPEFEAFLLEVLSDWQVTVPELGTVRAASTPVVVLTSNRTRDLSDALLRRCLHLHLDYPAPDVEAEILARKVPDLAADLAAQVARFVAALRDLDLRKAPSVAETIDWARGLLALGIRELDAPVVRQTLALVVKREEDRRMAESKLAAMVVRAKRS
jgi:MoxR-like ATPase